MAQEIVITSVPRGVRPGRTGFQIAMRTAGMRDDVCTQLESLGVYRHMPPGGGPNPVCYFHKIVQTGAGPYSVLGRIVDAGADYSSRSNKLAHLVVISQTEVGSLAASSPAAALLAIQSRLAREWTVAPEERPLPFSLAGIPPSQPRICAEWQRLMGDAGWSGVIAERAMANKPVLVIAPDSSPEWCQRILRLFDEAMALIPPARRWSIGFDTTAFTSAGVALRGTYAGSPESAARQPGLLVIDLAQPMAIPGEYGSSATVAMARTGLMVQARAVPQSPQRTGQPPAAPPLVDEFGFPVQPVRRPPPPEFSSSTEGSPATSETGKKPKRERVTRSGGNRDGGSHVYEKPNHWQAYIAWAVLVMILLVSVAGIFVWYLSRRDASSGKTDRPTNPPVSAEAAAKEAETKEAETKEAETKEAETKEAETKEAETKEAETKEAETKEAEAKESEAKEASSQSQAALLWQGEDTIKTKGANASLANSLGSSGTSPPRNLDWPKADQCVVIAKGIADPQHLVMQVHLPRSKHALGWYPSVKAPNKQKGSSMEWVFQGVPDDANKEWGRVIITKDKDGIGELIFKASSDRPDICSYVPFAISVGKERPMEIVFSSPPRVYSFSSGTLPLSDIAVATPVQLTGAKAEVPSPWLISELSGLVLGASVTDLESKRCEVVSRHYKPSHDKLLLKWDRAKVPGYVVEYDLTHTIPSGIQLHRVNQGPGNTRQPDWSVKQGDFPPSVDDFIKIVFQVTKDSSLRDMWSLKESVVEEIVYLKDEHKRDLEKKERDYNIIVFKNKKPNKKLRDALQEIVAKSKNSFVPVECLDEPSGMVNIKTPSSRSLSQWRQVVLGYAFAGCKRNGFREIRGSFDAWKVLEEEKDWVKTVCDQARDNDPLDDGETKDRNLVLAIYVVALLNSDLQEWTLRPPSEKPSPAFLETTQDKLFGPQGEALITWEWEPDLPLQPKEVPLLKIQPSK
jgi:hypothetical protein